jgi:toxin ParE1/3/4
MPQIGSSRFPLSVRTVPELNNPDFREIIVGNYRLIYRIRSGDVQILTVHHAARPIDPDQLSGGE